MPLVSDHPVVLQIQSADSTLQAGVFHGSGPVLWRSSLLECRKRCFEKNSQL